MTIESPGGFWSDYELIDSGDCEKLERFGKYILIRPEPKALWDKTLPDREWLQTAHVRFRPGAGFGKAGKEDSGTWEMLRKMDEQWPVRYLSPQDGVRPGGHDGLNFTLRLGLTAFKHVGVFPEQAPNWEYIYRQTKALTAGNPANSSPTSGNSSTSSFPAPASGNPAQGVTGRPGGERNGGVRPKVLNLFAYTGAASLAAKAAGADVTHLDSVRQVVTWARANMELSGLDNIRWVVEDAMKFVRREARRGNVYQGIILDPPAYGHGPDGEKWKLDECLFEMLKYVNEILAPENSFLVLNLYSNGYSAVLGETLVREAFCGGSSEAAGPHPAPRCKALDCGELVLRDSFGKALPLSIFVRLVR